MVKTEDAYLKKMQSLAQRLLDRLETQVENGEPDQAAIKQICATMKDLKDLIQPKTKSGDTGITVVLGEDAEQLSL